MPNIANIPKIHYCQKRSGNTARCSELATTIVSLCSKHQHPETNDGMEKNHRCDEHAKTPTVGKRVFDSEPLDQSEEIKQMNNFLHSLIGKKIHSQAHTAKELIVKYVKPNGGVMCLQPITKKWKFVYYHQIVTIFD